MQSRRPRRFSLLPLLAIALAVCWLAGTADPPTALAQTPASTAGQSLPDATLAVPWEGVLWQSMPNLTWAACDVSANTRKAIDLAIGQWSYAATNQGIPVRLTEVPCTNGDTQAQIQIYEASVADLPGSPVSPDLDVFGLTLVSTAQGQVCVIDITGPCVAQTAHVFLFTDQWQSAGLTYAQAAKTVAHEIGHAVGLGHAHYCTYDSIMAQDCEPIFQGLGPDDVQSIDALVDYDRSYFGQPPIHAQPVATPPSGSGMTITYHAGWNLVAGPEGTSFAASSGSLYTFLPGDRSYEAFPASQPAYDGYGYWAYFPQDVTLQLNGAGSSFYSVDAKPGEWFLLGNANGSTPMRVVGAKTVEVYDTASGQYRTTTTLQPGQAAWVQPGTQTHGVVIVAASNLTTDQIRCFLDLGSPATC